MTATLDPIAERLQTLETTAAKHARAIKFVMLVASWKGLPLYWSMDCWRPLAKLPENLHGTTLHPEWMADQHVAKTRLRWPEHCVTSMTVESFIKIRRAELEAAL